MGACGWNQALVIIKPALNGLHTSCAFNCVIRILITTPQAGASQDPHSAEVETEAQRREVKLISLGHTAVSGWSGPQPGFVWLPHLCF